MPGLSVLSDLNAVGIPHDPDSRQWNAKWVMRSGPYTSAFQGLQRARCESLLLRLVLTLLNPSPVSVRFVRFVRPVCPISVRWAFHTNLVECEVGYAKWPIYIDIPWPFCPLCPISMRWAFRTILIQGNGMRSGLCEVAHIHRHSKAYTKRVENHLFLVGISSKS